MLVALCVSLTLGIGCSPSAVPEAPGTPDAEESGNVEPAQEPSETDETTEVETDTLDPASDRERVEYTPTYSALGRRLRSEALHDSVDKLWREYAPRPEGYIEFIVGTGGNLHAVIPVPVDGVIEAESLVEDAVSLLIEGKLPTDSYRRPVDKTEVEALLTEAYELILVDVMATMQYQEQDILWIEEQENAEVTNEETIEELIGEYEFVRGCLWDASYAIADVVEDLEIAVEG